MGNRANVIFAMNVDDAPSPAIYLHWNGGPESIYPMLDKMAEFGVRGGDNPYAAARFVQIAGNFLGGTYSLGISDAGPSESWTDKFDHGDNGLYVIGWNGTKGYTVRRWLDDRWLTEDEVAQERKEVETHDYNTKVGQTMCDIVEQTSGAFFRKASGTDVVAVSKARAIAE